MLPPVALVLATLFAVSARAAEGVDLVVRNVNVVDVVEGRVHERQAIAVRDGRILELADDGRLAGLTAAAAVDGTGKFAIPGLWDMHVHFGGGDALIEENRNLLPLYLAYGITAVRDAAGDLSSAVLEWRELVAAGHLLGPTIFTSGPKIEGHDSIWPGDIEIGTRGELAAALDRLQASRVDFVKITDNTLTPDLFIETVRQARERDLETSAHIPLAVTVDEASAAGLGSIEHLSYAFKVGSPQEHELGQRLEEGELTASQIWEQLVTTFDVATAKAAFERLAERGTAVTPTLSVSRVLAYLDQEDHRKDEDLKYIGPGLRATYAWRVDRAAQDDEEAIRRRHERYERTTATLPLLQEAGVRILAGTDAGFLNSYNYPGRALHEELALFVRAGLTPLQALRAATLAGAEFMGKADVHGSLGVGKAADIVLLRANPLQDIAATRQIDTLILKGTVHDRRALDGLLAEVERRVAAQVAASPPP